MAGRPFDLVNGPLVRGCVVKLAPDFHLLTIATHHTVTDGWSLGVLLGELSRRYTAACRGEQPVIPPPVQFGEFVQWEVGRLASHQLREMEQYWLGQFVDPAPLLDLPTDRQRPALQSYAGARERFSLGSELSTRLLQFSAQQGVTPFMLLLSAVNLLLHKLSGQDDVVIGIPVAGQAGFGGILIGYCLNVLPVRSRIGEAMSFDEYLDSTKRTLLDAYERQAYPFNLLVKNLKIPRDPSRPPLITVIFNLDRAAGQPQFDELQVNVAQNTTDTAQFDLDLNVKQTEDDFHFDCDYSASLFHRTTIRRWLSHLETLLAEIVANPAAQLGQLRLLKEAERQEVLSDWNSTLVVYPRQTSLAWLFEEQVARTPDNIAVNCNDRHLTYAELNRRANRLARILLGAGAGPEAVVALLAERDIELLTAILAVFKAGAAYLPLDPYHPPQRVAQLLEQAGAGLTLTTRAFESTLEVAASGFPPAARPTILILEELVQEAQSEENLPPRTTPENLAYVIFTSGSTGAPKGAMVVQQGMVNHLYAKLSDLRLEAGDIVAQTATQCFDISVWQFLAALLVGGQVRIMPDEVVRDPWQLAREVERSGVTVLEVVPSLLQEVLNEVEADEAGHPGQSGLRWLLVTGEAAPPEVCRRWLSRYPRVPMMNAYGPTECSDDVTHYVISQELPADLWNVPIGKPIANTQLFILGERLEPEPVGVRGELYVGGDGVGRGYLGRADTTAERFLPDHFGGRHGARLYRTGDLTRRLPDGQIEFLGRLDHQVKVRGYRIELGEIEHALSRHAGVRQSVVVAREDAPGEKRIVAYYVAAVGETGGGAAAGADELREYLRERLPDYMIPGAFVRLVEIPLTPSGKIDRRALPAPERREREEEYEEPRTELEAILAEAWGEALGVERVGIRENFFELGGDSILSMRVVGRARARGVELSPAELFRYQSVAELAAAIQARQGSSPAHLSGAVPLTPIQRWFFDQLMADPQRFSQSALFEVPALMDARCVEEAVKELLKRHDALRLRFKQEAGVWKATVAAMEAAPFSLHDFAGLSPVEQTTALERVADEARAALSFIGGPLMRVALCELGEGRSGRLLIVIHHLAVDIFSWRILLEDFQTVYEQLSKGEGIEPKATTASFSQWARGLEEYARSEELLGQTAYWFSALRRKALPLPVDFEGGANTEASARTVKAKLNEQETQVLLQDIARAYRMSASEVLLAALAQAFYDWTGEESLLIDLESHGREEILDRLSVSRTVGWFTSIYPIHLDISGVAGNLETLKSIKEQLRSVPQGGIGWGLLKRLCNEPGVAEQMKDLPQAPILFNYLGHQEGYGAKASMRVLHESPGKGISLPVERSYLLVINGQVIEGQLVMSWTFSRNLHHQETVERLASWHIERLRAIVEACQSGERHLFSPSDFPGARLNQQDLDTLIASISNQDER
ncbi:MAG TPA: amino acid adenylation domain-containing protein [Blastocatellia bacterium]|nr:amino acid adenylation domain-containing protein [Blastocatellia bacterium]